ncbi:hypothetical protein OE903_22165 [Bacillus sp. B6(2022)]|nr:hypothetical protein [Bacillus sp. B6(2022)]
MKNLTAVVHDHSIIDQEMVDGYLKPFSDDQIFRGIFRLIRHREGDLASDVLKKMETPVLLIWGRKTGSFLFKLAKDYTRICRIQPCTH